MIHTIDRAEAGIRYKAPPVRCCDCDKPTKGGKLFCKEHCERTDRAQEVLAAIKCRQAEISAVQLSKNRGWSKARIVQAIPADGLVCREIMGLLLGNEEMTFGALGRELPDVGFGLVRFFASALRDAGYVTIDITKSKRALRVSLNY